MFYASAACTIFAAGAIFIIQFLIAISRQNEGIRNTNELRKLIIFVEIKVDDMLRKQKELEAQSLQNWHQIFSASNDVKRILRKIEQKEQTHENDEEN